MGEALSISRVISLAAESSSVISTSASLLRNTLRSSSSFTVQTSTFFPLLWMLSMVSDVATSSSRAR